MKNVACVGDVHNCPIHGTNSISSGTKHKAEGKQIATVGDSCACGGTIANGAGKMKIDGKPVATIGSTTSCGGTISSGASKVKSA